MDAARPKPSLKERAVREATQFTVMFFYLWVFSSLFVLQEKVVLAHEHIGANYTAFGFAFFNALVLAKVMLVADGLHFARQLEHHPLVYSVLYKSFAYTILFICFYIAEEVIVGTLRGKELLESLPPFVREGWLVLLIVMVIMFVELVPFFAFFELTRVLGAGELRALMLTRDRLPSRSPG